MEPHPSLWFIKKSELGVRCCPELVAGGHIDLGNDIDYTVRPLLNSQVSFVMSLRRRPYFLMNTPADGMAQTDGLQAEAVSHAPPHHESNDALDETEHTEGDGAVADHATQAQTQQSTNESHSIGVQTRHWHAWRIQPPSEHVGWMIVNCPRCVGMGTQGDSSLLCHPGGSFWCGRCGLHGQAQVDPKRTQAAPDFSSLFSLAVAQTFGQTINPRGLGLRDICTALCLEHPPDLGPIAGDSHLPDTGCFDQWLAMAGIELGGAYVVASDGNTHEGRWQLALNVPVRSQADGPIQDVEQILLDPATGQITGHQRAAGGQRYPLGWDRVDTDQPGTVVYVDHPLDALVLWRSGITAVALPDSMHSGKASGGDWAPLLLIEGKQKHVGDPVLALRVNDINATYEDDLGRRFGRDRCRRTRWQLHPITQGIPGAWRVWQEHGAAALRAAIDEATPFPVAGIYELLDVEDRFEQLYALGMQSGFVTGWATLDEHYTVKPGQWTVVTGIPGHGKSNFMDALMVNLAMLHGWKIGLFSPENQPIERHYASLMEKTLDAPFNDGPSPRISPEQKNAIKGWLNQHFKIILPDDDNGNWSLEGILELGRTLVYRHGIRGLVIDPWNEIDHARSGHATETDYISHALTRIRRFARVNGIHVWVVAHPHKLELKADGEYPVPTPYMISGGAHWRNKADNAMAIWRHVGHEDDDMADVHIQKIRFKECGRVGMVTLRHDSKSGRYIDDIDQTIRKKALKSGTVVASHNCRRLI